MWRDSEKLPIPLTLILSLPGCWSFPPFLPFIQEIPTKTFVRGSSWAKQLLQLVAINTGGQRAVLTSDPSTLAGSVGIFWPQLLDPEGVLVCRELLWLQTRCEGMELGFCYLCAAPSQAGRGKESEHRHPWMQPCIPRLQPLVPGSAMSRSRDLIDQ